MLEKSQERARDLRLVRALEKLRRVKEVVNHESRVLVRWETSA